MAEIRIQPATEELIPGKTAQIPIVIVLDQALKVRGLHATFHGAEETTAVYTTYNAATKSTQTHTAIEHADIVKQEFLLSGSEQKGFFGNLSDGFATMFGGGEHDVLEPGEYPFEVEVEIPADARPSFDAEKCRVFYELSVLVDIPLGRDLKASQSFRVTGNVGSERPAAGHVRTRYPEDQKLGLLDSWFSPDLKVEAALTENAFVEGDTIEGIFVVNTLKPLKFRAISVRLLAVEQTTAHGHTDSHAHQGEPIVIATDGVIEGDYSQQFQLPVSQIGPITTRGELFSIDCFVQIELDVPWAKDPKIRVPITLLST